jgi:hypothetical protein
VHQRGHHDLLSLAGFSSGPGHTHDAVYVVQEEDEHVGEAGPDSEPEHRAEHDHDGEELGHGHDSTESVRERARSQVAVRTMRRRERHGPSPDTM